mmetsp:Transcript_10315/g.21891  ORF Transcript_10315/g.21891 Transcript_10315/m.21891 type:complete len:287 (+) Transcript_10315:658-1518(+)
MSASRPFAAIAIAIANADADAARFTMRAGTVNTEFTHATATSANANHGRGAELRLLERRRSVRRPHCRTEERQSRNGASKQTRTSFVTSAVEATSAEQALPTATTPATSCIVAPVNMPMSLASAASAGTNFHSSGYRNMAIVPQSTTVPMAAATSCGSPLTTVCVAATAEQPQMAAPEEMSAVSCGSSFNTRMPSSQPRKSVEITANRSASTPATPVKASFWTVIFTPYRIIPARSSLVFAKLTPERSCSLLPGLTKVRKLPQAIPMREAHRNGENAVRGASLLAP